MLGGAIAAGLGLGAVAVAVLLLWITSPYPDSGPDGALHIAADLWLLAHGAELVRTETASGVPAPLGLTPLLLSALPLWLLYRAARHALEPDEDGLAEGELVGTELVGTELAELGEADTGEEGKECGELPLAGPTIGWLSAGYLLVGLAAVIYTSSGPVHVDPLSAVLHLPVVTVGALSYGVWTANGRPAGPLPTIARRAVDRIPRRVRTALTRPELLAAALRSAAAGTAVLLAGGGLLVLVSLCWNATAVQQSFLQSNPLWSGRITVALLALALAPNAAIWGAAYGLGPGFTVGGDSLVSPLGTSGLGPPYFPLLAALPDERPGWPLTWAAVALPLAAGIMVGWFTARAAVPQRSGTEAAAVRNWRETALTAALAGLGCAVATALLAGLAGGPLGGRALAHFGPSWWLTGGAALCWTTALGVPTALLLRWWWIRGQRDVPEREQRSVSVTLGPQRAAAPSRAVRPRPVVSGSGGLPDPLGERSERRTGESTPP